VLKNGKTVFVRVADRREYRWPACRAYSAKVASATKAGGSAKARRPFPAFRSVAGVVYAWFWRTGLFIAHNGPGGDQAVISEITVVCHEEASKGTEEHKPVADLFVFTVEEWRVCAQNS
jgi:hypothetical protein